MMQEGGVLGEQNAALERMVSAMQARDYDAMALSLADFAAALGTRTTAALAGMLTPMLEQLRALRDLRETDIKTRDHKLDMLIVAVEQISSATLAQSLSAEVRARLIEQIQHIPDIERRLDALEASNES